ncbi:response regulator [Tundrisphaera sp. TA3]|uniref:response regulator n=1 Tax=Tundrisphaera sp. TA3 TaxID=3435775 RepID=UPI003EBD968E
MSCGQVILVVEDSDEDFEATKRAFRKSEVTRPIFRCTDGEEAIDYLFRRGVYAGPGKAPRPAMILLDLNMPGTDGREVLEQIKSNEETRLTPVVILTTSSNPRDIDDCYRYGANSYLIKPVNFDRFLRSIRLLNEYWFNTVTLPVKQA